MALISMALIVTLSDSNEDGLQDVNQSIGIDANGQTYLIMLDAFVLPPGEIMLRGYGGGSYDWDEGTALKLSLGWDGRPTVTPVTQKKCEITVIHEPERSIRFQHAPLVGPGRFHDDRKREWSN